MHNRPNSSGLLPLPATRRWLRLLLAVVAVEAALSGYLRVRALVAVIHGEWTVPRVVAVVGGGWLLVLVAVSIACVRSLRAAATPLPADGIVVGLGTACHEWIWETDLQMRFTYCSPRVEALLGTPAADLIGTSTFDLQTPDTALRCRQIVRSALVSGEGWADSQAQWRRADGSLIWLSGAALPIIDEAGEIRGFRGVRRPLTDTDAQELDFGAGHLRIHQLLESGEIDIALQPITGVSSGRFVGAEALARFPDGRGPDEWFTDARRAGRVLELEMMTFFAALPALDLLPAGSRLSVNASPELIVDPTFQRRLHASEVRLDRLTIEITEHTVVHHYDALRRALAPFRELGGRLAVDDTGAGYASFSHILQLRPDVIKIDRSFITRLDEDPARRSMVTAMVLLALDLGALITAEGVESQAEFDAITELGVDQVQGYFVSRPTTETAEWTTWATRRWPVSDRLGLAVGRSA